MMLKKSEIIVRIAVALKDLFPDVFVTAHPIYPLGIYDNYDYSNLRIVMPKIALDFIKVFESYRSTHIVPLQLPEFEFDISIPDEIISQISIDVVKNSLKKIPSFHQNLSLGMR